MQSTCMQLKNPNMNTPVPRKVLKSVGEYVIKNKEKTKQRSEDFA